MDFSHQLTWVDPFEQRDDDFYDRKNRTFIEEKWNKKVWPFIFSPFKFIFSAFFRTKLSL